MSVEREMIERAAEQQGLTVQSWDEDEDGDERAKFGRYEITADDPSGTIFAGEEGEVVAVVVGAVEYRNQRVWFGFQADGTDSPFEIEDLSIIEPVE